MFASKPPALKRILATAVLGAATTAASFTAGAQSYPSRPITFIYPYASSATETMLRAMFAEASKTLGQPVVVEAKPGAGGKIGFEQMMRSPKDGYTLAFVNTPLAVNLALMDPAFKIEPIRDYTPITLSFDVPLLLVTNASLPFRDLKSMVAYGKANPGKVNIGTSGGRGTTGGLMVELFKLKTGFGGQAIPYKGEGPAMSDLLGGQIQGMVGSVLAAKPHIDSGKLVAIAVTSGQRVAVLPNVPTVKETGVVDVVQATTCGVGGPAGLSPDIVRTLNRALVTAVQSAEVRKKIEDGGMIVRGTSPEELTETIRGDMKRWAEIIKQANITLDD